MRADLFRDHFYTKVNSNSHCQFWWSPKNNIVRYFVMNEPLDKEYVRHADPHATGRNFVDPDPYPLEDRPDYSRLFEINVIDKATAVITKIFSNYPEIWDTFVAFYMRNLGAVGYIDRCDRVLALDFPDRYSEMEYFVPLKDTIAVYDDLRELFGIKNIVTNYPINIRTVKADQTWLSPMYERDVTAFSITIAHNEAKFDYVSKECEKVFAKYNARPHGGKSQHLTTEQYSKLYPKLQDFNNLRKTYDPKNLYVNDFIQQVFNK